MRALEPAVLGPIRAVQVVEPPERVEFPALPGRAHPVVLQVADRLAQVGDERPLVRGRQEAGAVLPGALRSSGPGPMATKPGRFWFSVPRP